MFFCLFVTCQNLHFGKYVRWSCFSVCLLLAKIYILASMFVGRVCLFVCLYGNFTKERLIPLIFKLQRRSNAQNVGKWIGYLAVRLKFWQSFQWKSSPVPQNGGLFENLKISQIGLFSHIYIRSYQIVQKGYFSWK